MLEARRFRFMNRETHKSMILVYASSSLIQMHLW